MSTGFFTDRDLGRRFPDILEAAGLSVERHDDRFAPNCPDETWLEHVGKRGLVAVTHDQRIRYKPNELAAVRSHGVALLVVVGKAPLQILAENFVATMPRISSFLTEHSPPFIARVRQPSPADLQHDVRAMGSITLWYP